MRHDDTHTLRGEYDFSRGVRGKHHECYRRGTNVAATCTTEAIIESATSNKGPRAATQVTQDREYVRES